MHIWSLAQCLLKLGHKVVIITHAYDDRKGIRYMNNGLKVYYCPLLTFFDQDVWPTLFAFFPLFRSILIREQINVVHTHQATSVMSIECALYARTMGYKLVYTDHSLFGFADAASIHINQVMRFILSDFDHGICVSNTCRENLALRARLHPIMLSTIPNAVDPDKFTPDPSQRRRGDGEDGRINVVIVSRLVYRKGIDLVAKVIPVICARYPRVHFIVGGDGNKKLLLEEMREKHQLQDRVEMLGRVPHVHVRNVLVRGHIFLNCSLTESFCIAILEAASCGLFVVSTCVGGVPEVLPPSMTKFAEPTAESIIAAIGAALPLAEKVVPAEFHKRVRHMYSWMDVARRTETVYDRVRESTMPTFAERLWRYSTVGGTVAGWLCCFTVSVIYLVWRIIEWVWPRDGIELASNFPTRQHMEDHKSDHGRR